VGSTTKLIYYVSAMGAGGIPEGQEREKEAKTSQFIGDGLGKGNYA
jgi:hypothetical protein